MNYNPTAGHKLIPISGTQPEPPTLAQLISRGINAFLKSSGIGLHRSGSYSDTVAVVSNFTITFGGTQPNTDYQVFVTPTNTLSSAPFHITNKTTTTFEVAYSAALSGTVAFDWALIR